MTATPSSSPIIISPGFNETFPQLMGISTLPPPPFVGPAAVLPDAKRGKSIFFKSPRSLIAPSITTPPNPICIEERLINSPQTALSVKPPPSTTKISPLLIIVKAACIAELSPCVTETVLAWPHKVMPSLIEEILDDITFCLFILSPAIEVGIFCH